MVPVGAMIPWLGASYLNGSNGTPSYLVGGSGVANLTTYLGDGWVICDGRSLPTDSVLNTGGNTFTPNLTNLYLLGASTFGSSAGNNSYTTSNSRSTFNSVAVNFNTNGGSGNVDVDHRHWTKHVHKWAGLGGNGSFTHDSAVNALAQNNNGVYSWGTGYAPYVNNVAHLGIAVNNNIVSLYTSNPIRPQTVSDNNSTYGPSGTNNAESNLSGYMSNQTNSVRSFNVNGGSGSVNTSSWDGALNNHSHTVNSVFPTYISTIYIMRAK
jgi:hypothetical protein